MFFKMSTCTCRGTNNNSLILTYFNKDVGKIIIQKVPGCVVLKDILVDFQVVKAYGIDGTRGTISEALFMASQPP